MPVTTNWSIFYANTATAGSVETITATVASSVEAALNLGIGNKTYRWAAAANRTAQAGMVAGERGYQVDTAVDYRYSGAAWVVSTLGATLVRPTSVAGTGTSLAATGGVVVLTAATSASLNGCFTSDFPRYIVTIDITTSAASTIPFVLRASGTNATTAYDQNRVISSNVTATSSQVLNAAGWESVSVSIIGGRHLYTFELSNPQVAAATLGRRFSNSTDNPMTAVAGVTIATLLHRTATAYDGFSITPTSGNMTGTITVTGHPTA